MTNNALQTKYFRGITTDELIAGFSLINGKLTPSLYHHDQLTSVTGHTAHDGTSQQGLVYRPFGDTQTLTGSDTNRLRYTGRELDIDTGLYYYRARYYDPSIGRFISEDPLGFQAGDVNFYAYVGNDPVNNNDPSGNVLQAGAGAVGAGVGLLFQAGLDIYNGRLSSFADYAGSAAGGFAGGVAATVCGPACAGAAAGATSNATRQAINAWNGGQVSASSFLVETAAGTVGGKVAGTVVPAFFKNVVPNSVKGNIGEALTRIELAVTGQQVAQRYATNPVNQNSSINFLTTTGKYVESKFGTSQLSTPQRALSNTPGVDFETQSWNYSLFSGLFAAGPVAATAPYAGTAAGGFLLYPNKANLNMMQSVYSK